MAGKRTRPKDEPGRPADLARLIGRQGIWTVQLQLDKRVRVRVRIVDARRLFDTAGPPAKAASDAPGAAPDYSKMSDDELLRSLGLKK